MISKYVGMGSIIQATPLIRSIRARFPRAKLIFVTGHSCRRMIERLDNVDRIITVDDRGLFPVIRTSIRTLAELLWSKPDLYFDLEVYSAYASIMSLLSLSRNRIGFYRESAQHKRGQLHASDVLQHEERDSPRLPPAWPDGGLPTGRGRPARADPGRQPRS